MPFETSESIFLDAVDLSTPSNSAMRLVVHPSSYLIRSRYSRDL